MVALANLMLTILTQWFAAVQAQSDLGSDSSAYLRGS